MLGVVCVVVVVATLRMSFPASNACVSCCIPDWVRSCQGHLLPEGDTSPMCSGQLRKALAPLLVCSPVLGGDLDGGRLGGLCGAELLGGMRTNGAVDRCPCAGISS